MQDAGAIRSEVTRVELVGNADGGQPDRRWPAPRRASGGRDPSDHLEAASGPPPRRFREQHGEGVGLLARRRADPPTPDGRVARREDGEHASIQLAERSMRRERTPHRSQRLDQPGRPPRDRSPGKSGRLPDPCSRSARTSIARGAAAYRGDSPGESIRAVGDEGEDLQQEPGTASSDATLLPRPLLNPAAPISHSDHSRSPTLTDMHATAVPRRALASADELDSHPLIEDR